MKQSAEKVVERFLRPQVMLPDPNDLEASASKLASDLAGSVYVPLQLVEPIRPIIHRQRTIASGAAMPKASVNEDCESSLDESKIRAARKGVVVQFPAIYSLPYKSQPEDQFRGAIAPRPNESHAMTSLFLGHDIHRQPRYLKPERGG